MEGDCSELRDAPGRFDIHVLTAGVLLQVALMPLIFYGGSASRSGSPPIVAITYAFEAVLFLSMTFRRSRSRRRALLLWMSSTLEGAVNGVLCGLADGGQYTLHRGRAASGTLKASSRFHGQFRHRQPKPGIGSGAHRASVAGPFRRHGTA